METGERLSAYLAGELDADETAALEAELAGDAALRARLERIRAANAALDAMPAVELPSGFSRRLQEAVAHEIDRQQATPQVDELAQRRLQRRAAGSRRLSFAAAAAAVLVVGAIGLAGALGGFSGDDAGSPNAAELRAGDRGAMEAAPADPLGEYVRVTDTDYDAESVQALAERQGVTDLPAEVDDEAALELESSRFEAFGLLDTADATAPADAEGGTTGGAATGGEAGDGDGAGSSEEGAPPPAPAGDDAAVGTQRMTSEPLADVRRCLPEIVSSANQPVIPLYAEVASYEGEPAIIYLVLTREPDAPLFDRIEAWVVGRADCFPLLFRQLSR